MGGMHMGGGGGMWRMGQGYDENAPKPKITKKLLKRVAAYFLPYWKLIALSLIAIIISAALGLVPPLIIRDIIDKALPSKDLGYLALLVGGSFAATLMVGVIDVADSYLQTLASSRIIYDIRNAMYKHLEHMSLAFFSIVKPGDIITRMTSDITGIQAVFRDTIANLVRNVFVLAFTAVALFAMNWKLAIIGLIIVPFFAIPTKQVGKKRWKIASETQSKLQELNQVVQESLSISGSTLMKIFNREKVEYDKFESFNEEVTKLQIKEAIAGRWFRMVLAIITTIGPLSIYFFGGLLFIRGDLSVGAIVTFVALLSRLYRPVTQISNIHVDITRSMALFERIFDYFDKKQDIVDKEDAISVESINGNVEFENVTFIYDENKVALNSVSFLCEPGTMTALVGPSGAGKTTFTNLIPRLYDATEGVVKIDGMDVRDMKIESLRSNVGMVLQDSYLFNSTVRENLLYAKEDATDEEITEACKAANIHDFIITLPKGYETIVGNRGVKLSGGEKQRMSIARVILKNPCIIILDEATSSLDSISEYLIQSAMEPLMKDRTSFVIAHRLSTVMAADNIIVLEDGEIKESGKHEDLLAKGGLYKELYDTQFRPK